MLHKYNWFFFLAFKNTFYFFKSELGQVFQSTSREVCCRNPGNSFSQGLKIFFIVTYLTKISAAELNLFSLVLGETTTYCHDYRNDTLIFLSTPKDFLFSTQFQLLLLTQVNFRFYCWKTQFCHFGC